MTPREILLCVVISVIVGGLLVVACIQIEKEHEECRRRCWPRASRGGGALCFCVLTEEAPR